ncbi:MAG: hypothetical protein ACK4FJ_18525 [Ferrovibrio sp.]|uniref:hypothetical protein n=1 Tax=Ferrovibrio sp. TaxID=1917215 RepID=UPI00391B0177
MTVRQYGDGTIEFEAGGATLRNTQTDAETFLRKLVAALNTVVYETVWEGGGGDVG